MAALLGLFLVAAIVVLGIVAFHAFQLHLNIVRLDTELAAQKERYSQDIKQRDDSCANAQTQYQSLTAKYTEDTKRLKEYCTRLAKWKSMADAEVKCAEMVQAAQAAVEKANAEALAFVSAAQTQATAVLTEAEQKASSQLATANDTATATLSESKAKAKAVQEETQGVLYSATIEAARIVEEANKKAQEIGGSAYEAMKNAALYDRTVTAMKNIIHGYGNQYLIPQQSLLDDLAEGFSHTKAGQELKRARESSKVMLRNGTAAACDYVEANRKETAVNFVVDAFNGKVDSILSRAKHDNAGKLEQQIRDAFTLVNYNGKAFRDARITDAYLAARLEELKWAAIVQQYVLEEREEQRRVKEQLREEARAAKEQERALREAAKEEETLRKAIEQAQGQFERASGEQRKMYEERLQEMADRLQQALERKERARSMAVTVHGF